MDTEVKAVYFQDMGPQNTDRVLEIARQRAVELGIRTILVATTTGGTAVKAIRALKGFRVIAVSHSEGYHETNSQEMTEENKRQFESLGGKVLTTAHTFAGISRAMRTKFKTYVIGDIIAETLKVFGNGTKVSCEICMMAADSGLVRTDEDVIAVAGSRDGADTALLLRPVNSQNFFDLKIREVLCKPRF